MRQRYIPNAPRKAGRRLPVVAVFIELYGLGRCSVALNILEMLVVHHEVDLYVKGVWLGQAPVLGHPRLRVIDLSWQPDGNTPRLARCLAFGWKLGPFRSWLWALCGLAIRLKRRYHAYVAFDPHGFVRCLSLFPFARPTYVSLELYFRQNHYNLTYPEFVMRMEHEKINRIRGLVIQSSDREELFREEYGLGSGVPAFRLPVTHAHPPIRRKSEYLIRRYPSLKGRKLLLHLGGIVYSHACVDLVEVWKRVHDWTLVFHGHSFGDAEILRKQIAEAKMDNVLVTDSTEENIESIYEIVASCDAGLCWYRNLSPNYYTAGQSSGKISAYLMCGLPVITNAYPASRKAIADSGCGVCVERLEELPDALGQIEQRHGAFASNAWNVYESTYWFKRYESELEAFVTGCVEPSVAISRRSA